MQIDNDIPLTPEIPITHKKKQYKLNTSNLHSNHITKYFVD
jgi:hypothetical protein